MREKIDAAKEWFAKFCITLTIYPVSMKTGESDDADALATADHNGRDAYRDKIDGVYKKIWNERMGKPREFLLILFVDPFQQVKYDNVWVNVSGNLSDSPVILITSADKASKHIVTHEQFTVRGRALGREPLLAPLSPPAVRSTIPGMKVAAPRKRETPVAQPRPPR